MAIRYDKKTKRPRNGKGKFISISRALKSSHFRKEILTLKQKDLSRELIQWVKQHKVKKSLKKVIPLKKRRFSPKRMKVIQDLLKEFPFLTEPRVIKVSKWKGKRLEDFKKRMKSLQLAYEKRFHKTKKRPIKDFQELYKFMNFHLKRLDKKDKPLEWFPWLTS